MRKLRLLNNYLILILLPFTGCSPKYYSGSFFEESSYSINDYPFQVLHSNNSYKSDTELISNLDFLRSDDSISILGGSILLVHHSGRFYEFAGDTIIDLASIDISIPEHIDLGNKRPYIDHLYQAKNVLIGPRVTDLPDLRFNFVYLNYQGSLLVDTTTITCLRWHSSILDYENREYELRFRNLSDDLIEEMRVTGNTINIEFGKYFELESPLIIVDIRDINEDLYGIIGVSVGSDQPNYCELWNFDSSAEALQIAHRLEFEEDFIGSEKMFQIAIEQSDNKVYELFLDNFLLRNRLK